MENENFIRIEHSQNFLRNPELVRQIVSESSISPDDLVYEIGPGKGIITDQLIQRAGRVVAVEKDAGLFKKLKDRFQKADNVEIKQGDFLKYELPEEEYKIFSNIPFNLTAAIIHKLAFDKNPPIDAYLIIQKEAAEKFATPPTGKTTQMSLLLAPWFELNILRRFEKTDFYPSPDVEAVLLRIRKREQALIDDERARLYQDFIIYSFGQWKLTLEKTLQKIFTYNQIKRLARDLGFDRQKATLTSLNFEQWLGLFNYFLIGVEDSKKQLVVGSKERWEKQQAELQKWHRTRKKQ